MQIVLCRGTEYTVDGITFTPDKPRIVDEQLGKRLLATRRFRCFVGEIQAVDDDDDLLGSIEHKQTLPTMPVNLIGMDNLNGKRVMLKRSGAIGDCVFVAQFAAHLKTLYPAAVVAVCINPQLEPLVNFYGHVDFILTPNEACKHEVITTFDYIVDFAGVIESNGRVPEDCYAAHFTRAGMTIPEGWQAPILYADTESEDAVTARQKANEILVAADCPTDGRYAVVLRGTSNSLKTWDAKIFHRVVDALVNGDVNTRTHVIVLGTKKDKIKTRFDGTPFVTDVLDVEVGVACALVAGASVVIGGDTGFTHFALSLGVPCVSYWCSTSPEFVSGRYTNSPAKFVGSKSKCHPCNVLRSAMCPHYSANASECTRKLDAAEIAEAAKAFVAGAQRYREESAAIEAPISRALQVHEATPLYNGSEFNVAFVVDSFNVWSGGAFYTWNLARAFAQKAGVRVWVLVSDKTVAYMQSIPPHERMIVVHDPNRDLLTNPRKRLGFQLAIGTPHKGGMDAVHYAKETDGCAGVCLVYETPNYIAKYRDGRDSSDAFWANYVEAMTAATHVWTISETVKQHLLEWQPQLEGKVEIVSPCVVESVANAVMKTPPNKARRFTPNLDRDDLIVLIARNVSYKGLLPTLQVIAELFAATRFSVNAPLRVAVIGNNSNFLYSANSIDTWAKLGCKIEFYESLSEAGKWQLLTRAKAVVHSSLFEGFGIPLAEAMYAATPVLARRLEVFTECFAQHPYYYSTDTELVSTLHAIFEAWDAPKDDPGHSKRKLMQFLIDARAFVKRRYTESQQRSRVMVIFSKHFSDEVINCQRRAVCTRREKGKVLRLAMITPWNVRCGVAETTKQILAEMPCTYAIFAPYEDEKLLLGEDGPLVQRCFNREFNVTGKLVNSILEFKPDVVHIQHEFSLYRDTSELLRLIGRLQERGIRVVITLHTVMESTFTQHVSALCDAVIICKQSPANPAKAKVIPLPIQTPEATSMSSSREAMGIPANAFVVGAFGMWQPTKGFAHMMACYNDLLLNVGGPVVMLISGYAKEKDMNFRAAVRAAKPALDNGGIIIFRDYAPHAEVVRRIAACDVMAYWYAPMQHYSASASIREAFANKKPAFVSDVAMFCEFQHGTQVYKAGNGGADTTEMVRGLVALQRDAPLRQRLSEFGARYTSECRSPIIAQKLAKLYSSL